MMKTDITAHLHEVFTTPAGAVYQSDKERCLYVDFGGKQARFSYPCLLRLKRRIERIDIERMLINPYSSDVEIISIAACDDCYVLNALEILAFRELLQGAFVMFQLNHIIKDCLQRIPA